MSETFANDTRHTVLRAAIYCPHCQHRHIDRGEWAEKPHSRHLCYACKRFFFTKTANIGVEDPPSAVVTLACKNCMHSMADHTGRATDDTCRGSDARGSCQCPGFQAGPKAGPGGPAPIEGP